MAISWLASDRPGVDFVEATSPNLSACLVTHRMPRHALLPAKPKSILPAGEPLATLHRALGAEGVCWSRRSYGGARAQRPRSCLRPRHFPSHAESIRRLVLDAVNRTREDRPHWASSIRAAGRSRPGGNRIRMNDKARLPSVRYLLVKIECHENAVWVRHIVVKWRTLDEAMAPIESNCGSEVVP
jgi:hypothetical protein